jgi:hypothetical protein
LRFGKTLNNKQFFKVKFGDGSENWFSEDRVFIDNVIREKWNEEHREPEHNHPDDVEVLLNAPRNDEY